MKEKGLKTGEAKRQMQELVVSALSKSLDSHKMESRPKASASLSIIRGDMGRRQAGQVEHCVQASFC